MFSIQRNCNQFAGTTSLRQAKQLARTYARHDRFQNEFAVYDIMDDDTGEIIWSYDPSAPRNFLYRFGWQHVIAGCCVGALILYGIEIAMRYFV
jgi:hypothetical protein